MPGGRIIQPREKGLAPSGKRMSINSFRPGRVPFPENAGLTGVTFFLFYDAIIALQARMVHFRKLGL